MTSLEQWLSVATHDLSAESAEQVRAEIQQHCDSACETGETTDAAIAALGDPRAANRGYRKVLLTAREAAMAPGLTRFKRPGFRILLLQFAVAAAVIRWQALRPYGPGFWPITIAVCGSALIMRFFPVTSLARCRVYICLLGAQSLLLCAIGWRYSGPAFGITLAVTLFFFGYLVQQMRMSIFRKLEAGQTHGLLPVESPLTPIETIVLGRLQHGEPYENVSTAVFLAIVAGMTVWLPGTFVPMATCIVAICLAQRLLPIYDEERSRRYRIAKWTLMGVAGALPVLYGARIPWSGAIFLLYLFRLFDWKSIAIRRKLPVAEWPKKLYW